MLVSKAGTEAPQLPESQVTLISAAHPQDALGSWDATVSTNTIPVANKNRKG
jgi:hypothetical protein